MSAGFSLWGLPLLQSKALGTRASVAVVHRLSCSEARGNFPDQGSNPCPLHQQADSCPLYHQGFPSSVPFSHRDQAACERPGPRLLASTGCGRASHPSAGVAPPPLLCACPPLARSLLSFIVPVRALRGTGSTLSPPPPLGSFSGSALDGQDFQLVQLPFRGLCGTGCLAHEPQDVSFLFFFLLQVLWFYVYV